MGSAYPALGTDAEAVVASCGASGKKKLSHALTAGFTLAGAANMRCMVMAMCCGCIAILGEQKVRGASFP